MGKKARRHGGTKARRVGAAAFVLSSAALARQTPPEEPASQPQQGEAMHWASRLGLRAARVDQVFPVVDRVVLVPDAATYVDELFKWSPLGRWPVLFEDDRLAPLFISRFDPTEVIRREPVGTHPKPAAARRTILESVVVRTWGGDPSREHPADVFKSSRYVPPGVVIASVDDPAWTAAVALASGRGAPLLWLDDSFGRPDGQLDADASEQLRGAVDRLVRETGHRFEAMGDEIDAITLCRSVGGRMMVTLPPAARLAVTGQDTSTGPYAMTDLVGRHADGERYAITGWIFGDETRCAYVAMCSLFLPRDRIRLVNTYPEGGQWGSFGIANVAEELDRAGYQTRSTDRDEATDLQWQRALPEGLDCDVFVMNTKGNPDFFDMAVGRCHAVDVPVLHAPVAVHLVHSWSMQSPASTATVGGRWLDHGAYAYVGSMQEPFLGAFIPPIALARRWAGYVPFLVAARHLKGPFGLPWRVNTFGDPLMLCRPGADDAPPRLARAADYGVNLRDGIAALLREAPADASGRTFEEAIRTLVLLGEDEIAAGTWRLALQNDAARPSARAALPALFRMRDREMFLRAWALVEEHDELEQDMLWHLCAPVKSAANDPGVLRALGTSIRAAQPHVDLERLAPVVARRFGRAHARLLIENELDRATSRRAKRELNELLNEYQ